MAVSTDAYFSNSVVGHMNVGGNVDIYKIDSSPKFPIGQGFIRADGNKYRYGHFGAATGAGLFVSTDVSESCMADKDNSITSPAAAFQMADENSGVYPGAIGSKYVIINTSATVTATADLFAGGYLITTDDTGEGFTYRIKGNTAKNDPATDYCRIELYDPIVVAMSATTDASIIGCKYANLEGAIGGGDTIASGVSCSSAGANQFGWVCTSGVIGALQSGSVTAGQMITLSTQAGAFCGLVDPTVTGTANTLTYVGFVLDPGDATGYAPVQVLLE